MEAIPANNLKSTFGSSPRSTKSQTSWTCSAVMVLTRTPDSAFSKSWNYDKMHFHVKLVVQETVKDASTRIPGRDDSLVIAVSFPTSCWKDKDFPNIQTLFYQLLSLNSLFQKQIKNNWRIPFSEGIHSCLYAWGRICDRVTVFWLKEYNVNVSSLQRSWLKWKTSIE